MSEGQGHNILVVDDEEDIRDLIGTILEDRGYKVHFASGGQEALELAKRENFHLVLSDIRMPKGDGMTLLKSLREINPVSPIIFLMTGFAEVTEQECLQQGANKVIFKPFTIDSLIEAIGQQITQIPSVL